MKTLILLASLISSQAFAFDVCKYEGTFELREDLEKQGKIVKTSDNHKKFTAVEKSLIHTTITTDRVYAGETITPAQALRLFGDYYQDETEPGSDAGEIIYYQVDGKKLILVHYWPGENEYGAIFETKGSQNVQIASIGDGFVECL